MNLAQPTVLKSYLGSILSNPTSPPTTLTSTSAVPTQNGTKAGSIFFTSTKREVLNHPELWYASNICRAWSRFKTNGTAWAFGLIGGGAGPEPRRCWHRPGVELNVLRPKEAPNGIEKDDRRVFEVHESPASPVKAAGSRFRVLAKRDASSNGLWATSARFHVKFV